MALHVNIQYSNDDDDNKTEPQVTTNTEICVS
jgi:hypothetical protein